MKEKSLSARLLWSIVVLQTGSMLLSLVEGSFGGSGLFQWLQWGILAAVAVCLFSLGREHLFFRLTGIGLGLVLALNLVSTFLSTPEMLADPSKRWIFTMLYWLGLVVKYPTFILEYLAYGKAAVTMKKKWLILMVSNVAWSLLGYGISELAAQMYTMGALNTTFLDVLGQVLWLINLLFRLLDLWFLFQTYQVVQKRDSK